MVKKEAKKKNTWLHVFGATISVEGHCSSVRLNERLRFAGEDGLCNG